VGLAASSCRFHRNGRDINPALTGAAFAVFGWIFRLIASGSIPGLGRWMVTASNERGDALEQWHGWFVLCLVLRWRSFPWPCSCGRVESDCPPAPRLRAHEQRISELLPQSPMTRLRVATSNKCDLTLSARVARWTDGKEWASSFPSDELFERPEARVWITFSNVRWWRS